MKRGIPIALQAAGAVLACLVTTLNHPVIAIEQPVLIRDTAFYFNEQGKLIYCDTKAFNRAFYVIRTCSTYEALYADWIGRNPQQSSSDFEPAKVNNITCDKSKVVEDLIIQGRVTDTAVKNNVIPILDKMTLHNILFKIIDSTEYDREGKFIEYGGDGKFREYGGGVWTKTRFEFIIGRPTDPRQPYNEGIDVGIGPLGHYHSHPGGEIRKPIGNGKDSVYAFIQAPSKQDTREIENKTGYVFALNKDVYKLFIYDSSGVNACLPLDSLKTFTPCR